MLRAVVISMVIAGTVAGCASARAASACDFLVAREVRAAMQVDVGAGRPQTGTRWRQCDWEGDQGRRVSLYVSDGRRYDGYVAEAQGTGVPVIGLGKRAFWHPLGVIFATDGEVTVRVQLYELGELRRLREAEVRAGLERLAQLALERASAEGGSSEDALAPS